MKKTILTALCALALGWNCLGQPANLSPNLQEIVKLTQAHMSDDVIVAYIRNSGAAYNLSADDILYLNSQGVTQPVISELLHTRQNSSTPTPLPVSPQAPPVVQPMTPPPAQPMTPPPTVSAPPDQPPPDSEVNLPYFQTQLAPSGVWVDVPGYGMSWRPNVAAAIPGWRPYADAGHWIYTDDGWSWQSDYPWGDIAFHYGRWYHDFRWGWVWRPGYNWGPAWVSWRHAEGAGFCGWAPLPPEARFEVGVGLTFGGHVGLDIDFGLPASAYVFIPFDHFWEHDYHHWEAPVWRSDALFRTSIVINDYHFDGGHFVVGGLGRERVAMLTHRDVVIERPFIRDERIARAREFQHVHSAEVRHEIGHDAAVRQEQAVRHDVRAVEATHHEEAVRRAETTRGPAPRRAASGAEEGRRDGRDGKDRDSRDSGNPR